jgi:hypothetical protein
MTFKEFNKKSYQENWDEQYFPFVSQLMHLDYGIFKLSWLKDARIVTLKAYLEQMG